MNNIQVSKNLNILSTVSMVVEFIIMLLLICITFVSGIDFYESYGGIFNLCLLLIPVASLIVARIAKNMNPQNGWATLNTILSIMLLVFAAGLCLLFSAYSMMPFEKHFSAPWPNTDDF